MKQNSIRLTQQYVTTLGQHLKNGPQAGLSPAVGLGRRAVVLGLETLDLARIHEQALVRLNLNQPSKVLTKRAGIFFAEANTAIEATHWDARQSKSKLAKVMASLDRRTQQLAASNRELQRVVFRRKDMEETFAKRGKHQQRSLEESLELQNRLRQLTHRVLLAQEDERKKISLELQDDIAQTLFSINVRLLTLKQEAKKNTTGLKNKIASTQRLVANSARSVRRASRKIGGT